MNEYTRKNSLRLQGYDYSRPGYYFITICAKNGEAFFGAIHDDQMSLSACGNIAVSALKKTAAMTDIGLNCFIVMPNHVHFIAVIVEGNYIHLPRSQQRIPAMVQHYKTAVTKTLHFSPWHRSFYDEIVKSQTRLDYIRAYIKSNPANWASDKLHPHNFEEYIRKHPL